MGQIPFITSADVEEKLSWTLIADALSAGHKGNRAEIGDLLLQQNGNAMLNRAAWIDGSGVALKSMSVFPKNADRNPETPTIQGVMILFDDETGEVRALIDGVLVTRWKTAGDSMLGARLLARKNSQNLLIVGSGKVAASLIDAYLEIFPSIKQVEIWSRTNANAEKLAQKATATGQNVVTVSDLPAAAGRADIISCATMSTNPVISGGWVKSGTHVDLIGAYTPQMREADDELLQKSEIFVDARATTIEHIGELMMPLASGAITKADILGDFYDLCQNKCGRSNDDAITVFKNGGGAHLDLLTGLAMLSVYQR